MNLEEKFKAMVSSAEDEIENFNDFSEDKALVWASTKIKDQSSALIRLAVALDAIIHSTNHCGCDATLFSDFAGKVADEIQPDLRAVLGDSVASWTDQRAELADLRARLEKAEKDAGWQPIETAPKDGTAVLGSLIGSDIPHPVRFKNGQWVSSWDGFKLSEWDGPTHWMPLPKRPIAAIAKERT